MRGWKVSLDPDLAYLSVGRSRGTPVTLQPLAVGKGRSSPLRVLLVDELPESWTDEHEQALMSALSDEHGGEWVLLQSELLNPRWAQLTESERRRMLAREDFRPLHSWHSADDSDENEG